jgi:hypothetical protein
MNYRTFFVGLWGAMFHHGDDPDLYGLREGGHDWMSLNNRGRYCDPARKLARN